MTSNPAVADPRPEGGGVANSPAPDRWATLARQLAGQQDRDAVLECVTAAALTHVDGAEHAGVAVLGGAGALCPVTGDGLARDLEGRQHAVGEGPSLSVLDQGVDVVVVDDLTTDPRWPRLADAVAHLAIRSALSLHLYITAAEGRHTVGVLNVYAGRPSAFTTDAVRAGLLLAADAALAAAGAERVAELRAALDSRDLIGQAKGILMERGRITADDAFDLLVDASQRTNRKLRDVADLLVTTGELALPDDPPSRIPCGAADGVDGADGS